MRLTVKKKKNIIFSFKSNDNFSTCTPAIDLRLVTIAGIKFEKTAMSINLRTPEQIAKMRIAGKLAAEVLELIGEYVIPGVSTEDLDRICHDHIVEKQKLFPLALATEASEINLHLSKPGCMPWYSSEKKILKKGYN